jgi:hypothetical protein
MVVTTQRAAMRIGVWLLAALVVGAPARMAAAQGTSASGGRAGASDTVSPADLARIRKALETSPTLNLDENRLRYYVRILARQPNFMDFMKGYDFKNGPTRRGNPMTHQEFLSMVTPREMNSSGGITAMETLQFAFTNWLGQSLVKKAIEDLKNAKSEREVQDIRDRIDRELAALRPPGGSN